MRVIEVIDQFSIPFDIVINKAEIQSPFKKNILNYMKKHHYSLLGLINFDVIIPKAMAVAKSVIEFAPQSEVANDITNIYLNLKDKLSKN